MDNGGGSVCLGDKPHHPSWASTGEAEDAKPWVSTWCDDMSVEGPQHLRVGDILGGRPVTLLRNLEAGSCILGCVGTIAFSGLLSLGVPCILHLASVPHLELTSVALL